MARPREFDEEAVLGAAGDAFWLKGYEATSTRDLSACTGLTASSLYAAFGDKRNLFRRSLTHYLESILHERMTRLETTLSPGLAIAGFFDEIIERSVSDKSQRGCMLVNSALESSSGDPDFQRALALELKTIENFFHRCVVAGRRAGEIPATVPAEDAARHLLSVLMGIRVFARIRPERALLTGAVRQALATLGLPWPPKPAGTASRSTPRSTGQKRGGRPVQP